jgi:amidohydrolase
LNTEKLINDSIEEIIEIRRYLHQNPELSQKEYNTMGKICSCLSKWGVEYKKNVADTGVVAIIKGRTDQKVIGVRADMDALPVKEESNVMFSSVNENVMHACGHDIHMSVLLGLAKILITIGNEIDGSVKLFFQPAEETIGGAKRMINEGCLENPHVDAVLGLHVNSDIDVGKIGLKYGKMYAASDMITITVMGEQTHGAYPHNGIDPIIISANIIMALQTLVSRNIAPYNSAVFTVGSIHAGTNSNIIPKSARMDCILRTLDPQTREFLKKRTADLATNIAKSYGGTAQINIEESYGPLINDNSMVDTVKAAALETIGEENISIVQEPCMGTDDFSYFAAARKACYFNLGIRNKDKGYIYPIHSGKFAADEGSIALGIKIYLNSILKYFENN